MADVFERIDATLRTWIERQHVYFVATAPRGDDGFVNCSPKGLDSLRVLDERTVAYLDLTGSGVETIAHLKENGRIVRDAVCVRRPAAHRAICMVVARSCGPTTTSSLNSPRIFRRGRACAA